MYKTLLIGSGEFAIPIFKKALELNFLDIKAIVTQPDKPFGRKQEIQGSPVFEALKDEKIVWFKPQKFRNEYEEIIEKIKPELVLVASYGQILPKEFIDYAKFGVLNFHGSLLPTLRGAVPVQMAILQGLKQSGVTLQIMTEALDEGDIISRKEHYVKDEETSGSLMDELSKLSVQILEEDLERYLKNEIIPQPQDSSLATYCYKSDIEKEKAEINFETDVLLAERMIRAFYPWPIAYVIYKSKLLKIFQARVFNQASNTELKLVRDGKKLLLHLHNGTLELLELQLEGKKRDTSNNYFFLTNI